MTVPDKMFIALATGDVSVCSVLFGTTPKPKPRVLLRCKYYSFHA